MVKSGVLKLRSVFAKMRLRIARVRLVVVKIRLVFANTHPCVPFPDAYFPIVYEHVHIHTC